MIKTFIKNRQKQKRQKSFMRGYNFAAGHLLRGHTFMELENIIHGATYFGKRGGYHVGVEKAIEDFRKRMRHNFTRR